MNVSKEDWIEELETLTAGRKLVLVIEVLRRQVKDINSVTQLEMENALLTLETMTLGDLTN